MNDDPSRVMVVFAEALQLPAREREAHLDRACSDDCELRLEVEALLQAHETAGDFLEKPAGEITADEHGGVEMEPPEK